MGFGNPASQAHVERKRHLLEQARLREEIDKLAAERDFWRSRAPHASACGFWRHGECDCTKVGG